MNRYGIKFSLIAVIMFMASIFAGTAYAATSIARPYGNLYTAAGNQWAPNAGDFYGSIAMHSDGYAKNTVRGELTWNQTAINWMRSNSGQPAITFHSASPDGNTGESGGCDNYWWSDYWYSSNLPGATYQTLKRNCSGNYPNEIRIKGNQANIAPYTRYYGSAMYRDTRGSTKGQINVDTYWVKTLSSDANFHQKYCIVSYLNITSC